MTVTSRIGSVQFSSASGLRTSRIPPASWQLKPSRRASSANVGAHMSAIDCSRLMARGVPGCDVVPGVVTVEPLAGQRGELLVRRIVIG